MKLIKGLTLLSASMMLAACGSSSDDSTSNPLTTYTFDSKVTPGSSAVSNTGQTTRHLLINEITQYVKSSDFQSLSDASIAEAKLNRIYATGVKSSVVNSLGKQNVYTDATEATPISITPKDDSLQLLQTDFNSVSDGKNLQSKLAGCDNDFSQTDLIGWTIDQQNLIECGQKLADDEVAVLDNQDKAHTLIQQWFADLSQIAVVDGSVDVVSDTGLDYQQLIQKFLLGAVTYSQAAKDYLKADKGLLKQNHESDNQEDFDSGADASLKLYTSLEHQWDEGFGYFGAARDYLNYSDAEYGSVKQYGHDTNGDLKLDVLNGEYSFGHSINASKRDNGSDGVTDFSEQAMEAFIAGRKLIQDNYGTDPIAGEGYHVQLVAYAEAALGAWEKAIAATTVHYINALLGKKVGEEYDGTGDIDTYIGVNNASIDSYAKHWSELKGFALSLQFSPIAKITEQQLLDLHLAIGEQPVTSLEGKVAYITALETARGDLKAIYFADLSDELIATW